MIKVAYSILSADFAYLAEEVEKLQYIGIDAIHVDIMDGHFVPNLSMGPKIVTAIRKHTRLFLDVHLMIYNPFDHVESFIAAGADLITFHVEATEDVEDTINYVKKCGRKVGLAINPATSVMLLERYLGECDLVLLMSVNPGFGGQQFKKEVVKKVFLISEMIKDRKLSGIDVQVDGGINPMSAKLFKAAGANFLVSGEYLHSCKDMAAGVKTLKDKD